MNMVGRILYGLPLLVFGLLHFMAAPMMAGMMPAFVPGGIVWVYITGVALILAAIAIIANRLAPLASLLLGILLLSFASPRLFSGQVWYLCFTRRSSAFTPLAAQSIIPNTC